MPVRDERAARPKLSNATIDSLKQLFASLDEITAAFIVGSHAHGSPGPLSDLDIAVLFDESCDRTARQSCLRSLYIKVPRIVKSDEVDIVDLQAASPAICADLFRDRVPLVVKDPIAVVTLDREKMLARIANKPLQALNSATLRKRIKQGRFGRHSPHRALPN